VAAAAALAQQQDDEVDAAAAGPLQSVSSSEIEQARLEGEVRALARLAAATRDPAESSGKMPVVAPDAELLQRTRDEIDRLRSELGLGGASGGTSGDGSSGSGGGHSGFNVDAPAWQPGRKW
jgi:hypothetical protein